jgi:eukaryotic-like serine/threonine-protein kinase
VSKFLTGLFESADPYTSRGETITARELLDKGAQRVRTELEDQPDVLADMLITIGNAYGNLGLLDEAIAILKEAYGIREKLFGTRNAATVQAAWRIEEYLVLTGAYEEADSIGRAAVATARELGDKDLLANALGSLGQCVNYEAKYDEAEKFYNEAIRMRIEIHGADDVEITPVMNNLALMYHELSRYEEADSLFRRALAIQMKEWGERHPETNTTRYNYAQLLSDEGHLSEAQQMWKEVLATDRALYPPGHPSIAYTLSAYGRLLSRIGGYAEAEKLQREALAIRRKNHGNINPDVAYSLNSLGSALLDEAKYSEADSCYNEAYEINVELSGHTQPVLGIIMNNRGDLYYDIGNYAKADSLLNAAYAYQTKLSGGEDRNSTSVTLMRRARVQQALGNLDEAERLAREGVAISDRLHEDQGLWAAGAKIFLAEIRLEQGAVEEAETTFANALVTIRDMETGRPKRPRDTESLLGLGMCRLARGDAAGADRYLREALDISTQYRGDNHPETARIKIALARALMAENRNTEAEGLLRASIASLSPLVMPQQIDLVAAHRLQSQLRRP